MLVLLLSLLLLLLLTNCWLLSLDSWFVGDAGVAVGSFDDAIAAVAVAVFVIAGVVGVFIRDPFFFAVVPEHF